MSTSQSKTSLNPCATEFVPSFARQVNTSNGGNSGMGTGGYNQFNQRNYHNNNHHNHHHHNHNNRSNNYNNNHNNNNNYRNHNNNNSYYNNNFNQNDVDPIEMEARCEAVIEILQDDNIRDQLNPVTQYEASTNPPNQNQNYYYNNNTNNNNNNNNNNNDDEPTCEDEEEMLEMMAMQEECRLEMMKFYIQSQNPALFEEIYHDVSYPDAIKKPAEESSAASAPKPVVADADNATKQDSVVATTETTNGTQSTESTTELKDLIINSLNPDAYEFIPTKFSDLNLNDESTPGTDSEVKKD